MLYDRTSATVNPPGFQERSEGAPLRAHIAGLEQRVPLLDGRVAPYVNLDNAASTPPLKEVLGALERFIPFYSSVHRGSGFKSRLSTEAYEQAHDLMARFVGADPATNTVIFGKNTTEAINKLANRLPLAKHDVVLTTLLEHHSNDLPWRGRAEVVHVAATPEGRLDEEDFDRQLARYGSRVALVTVTGASNVTGFIQPIHRLARKVHAVGGKILVDAAQLAPHRPIDMRPDDDPEHLDFIALSAHKMYAPFGTGALVGARKTFLQSGPDYRGGGTVDTVTLDEIVWADVPDREEAGSPNVVGAVAMAVAAQALMRLGMDRLAEHERILTAYALERLQTLPGLTLYGETDPRRTGERVGVIPFNLAAMPHALVAAILGFEGGIGVRSGCFCAQPYVAHLLQVASRTGQHPRPGMVRVSFGAYNTHSEIDHLMESLEAIVQGRYRGRYALEPGHGDYLPVGYEEPTGAYFSLTAENRASLFSRTPRKDPSWLQP
jgi:cysteine desulfurase / selenocysteine lyase